MVENSIKKKPKIKNKREIIATLLNINLQHSNLLYNFVHNLELLINVKYKYISFAQFSAAIPLT